jgi:hypothetical protein
MDDVRLFLLLEIERQCSYIVKAKSDLDSIDQALKFAALEGIHKITIDTTGTLASVMDAAKQVHFDVNQARLEMNYAQQALLVAAGILSRCLGWHSNVKYKHVIDRIRYDLGVDDTSVLKSRSVRDTFEHIDERIESLVANGARGFVDSNLASGNPTITFPQHISPLRHMDTGATEISAQNRSQHVISLNYWAVAAEAEIIGAKARDLLVRPEPPAQVLRLVE